MLKLSKWLCGMFVLLFIYNPAARASHLYGSELYYTQTSGSLYTITLIVYGDCSGTAFPELLKSTPEVKVYDGSSLKRTMNLKIRDTGIEVTPVCAGSLGSTTCRGGTVPGVKKYTYTDTITLGKSGSWRFLFTGKMNSLTSAGRSGTITNIFTPGTTVTQLEATLNNLSAENSNPTFTTIPTPFFCISVPQEYNQGAVDPNTGDNLLYELVPGVDAGSSVTYRSPYTATAPLATVAGTYNFNSATGQLTFTPSAAQISLVVCKVSEYRGGVLVGTSMREMNFIVLASCANHSPDGSISGVTGGTATGTTTIDVCLNEPTLSFTITPKDLDTNKITVTYAGLPTGATMTVTGSGTVSPSCAFSWDIRSVAPGTYYFYMTYQDDACPLSSKQTVAYTINIYPVPAYNLSLVSAATCTRKAVFQVTPLNGNYPWKMQIYAGTLLRYSRSGITGAITDSIAPGIYRIRMSSAKGCYKDTTVIFVAPVLPSVDSISMTQPSCFDGSDGSISISGTGGVSPYTYANGSGTYTGSGTFGSLKAGTYTLHVRDANLCIKDSIVVLTQPPVIAVTYTSKRPTCKELSDGAVTLAVTGGTAPYTYAAATSGPFGSSALFSGLKSGTYTFRVKDSKECTKDITVTLTDSVTVTGTATTTPVACFGAASGSLTVVPGGGAAPYTYSLDGSSYGSSSTFPGLPAGTYKVYIKDGNGCLGEISTSLTQPAALVPVVTATDPLCYDSKNGKLVLAGSGGTSPYTYALNAGTYGTSGTFSGLDSGTYTLKVKDSNGCIKDTLVRLKRPDSLSFAYSLVSAATCISKAVFRVTPLTGILPWDMTVSSGTTTIHTITGIGAPALDSLNPGTYNLHMANVNGCTADMPISLMAPQSPGIQSLLAEMPSCNGGADGKITISGKDGLAPYTYANGSSAFSSIGSFTGLNAGTYTLRVKDANSCTRDTTMVLSQPTAISISAALRRPICKERSDGEVRISGAGGTAPYQYALGITGTFATSGVFSALASGTYMFRIRDKNNCTRDTVITLTDSVTITATTEITGAKCSGTGDGRITVLPAKGSAPYTYALGTGSWVSGSTFSGLVPGTYTIQVRDAYGCAVSITATVTGPSPLNIVPVLKKPACEGYLDGSVSLSGSGGTAPYTYAINSGAYSTTALFSGLGSGSYILHVKDNNGCIKDTTVNLSQPNALTFTTALTMPLCNGGADGTVLVSANGGTPGYMYTIGDRVPQSDNLLKDLKAGQWFVQVKDINGCTKRDTVMLTEPDKLRFSDIALIDPTCEGYADGAVSVIGTGGVPAYKFRIDGGAFTDIGNFPSQKEGTHILRIRDRNNCIADSSVTLTGYPHIVLDSTDITPASCFGKADGAFLLYASGGNPPLSYYFTATGKSSAFAAYNELRAGTYTVRVSDFRNCRKDFQVAIPEPEALKIVFETVHNDCTGFDTSGRLTAKVSGGTAPYTYLWSTGVSGPELGHLANGWYRVQVSDANQCTDSLSGEVAYDNCCTPAIPNAFTPNNDGKNDQFRILYRGNIVLKEFIIYNRYGQQVFSTLNVDQGWDGTFQGQKMEVGVYFWYIRMICGNSQDKEVTFKGDVTLLR